MPAYYRKHATLPPQRLTTAQYRVSTGLQIDSPLLERLSAAACCLLPQTPRPHRDQTRSSIDRSTTQDVESGSRFSQLDPRSPLQAHIQLLVSHVAAPHSQTQPPSSNVLHERG